MNLTTETTGAVAVVRVGEPRMMYPILSDFSSAVTSLIAGGTRHIVIDLTPVTYVDSATIGCLMDLDEILRAGHGQHRLDAFLHA